jgi:DNA-directed RNA polymerase subunit RPC12/RpoP
VSRGERPAGTDKRPRGYDPWRYVCPDCGSVQVFPLVSDGRKPNADYAADGSGTREAERHRRCNYRCSQCGAWHVSLRDKKAGGKAKP